VQAAADAAAALAARREEIARRWADLPLFTTVFAGQREDAHGAASRLVDALVDAGRSGRTDDFRAGAFAEVSDVATPVIRLWEGIVAVPLIGTLDSGRSQMAMESLLNGIVEEVAQVAILDITGVPMVDTFVAQHLMKTALAVRLTGAECVISGIRPQIAQTIVHLGIDLGEITTRSTLSDALKYALTRTGARLGTGG
jgi:rsbT co-antagonist protein RsbR